MKSSFAKMFAHTLGALLLGSMNGPGRPTTTTRRSGSKASSKCHHGSPGIPGAKMARLAAEHRLGMPSGRPGPG